MFFQKIVKEALEQLKRCCSAAIPSTSALFRRHLRRNQIPNTHNGNTPFSSFSFNLTRHHSGIRPIKQANKQNKQRQGEWWLAAAPAGPSWPPRRDGLMTNWCSSSITLSTFSTPVASVNGSILSALPLLSPSSLTPNFNPPSTSPSAGSLTSPLQPLARSWPVGGTMGV